MIEIIDFTDFPQQFNKTYGGASGRKYDIEYQGEPWFLKFPSNIRSQVNDISYSNGSVSEYLGSHIYQMMGMDVHETRLGIFQDKCVVACKDVTRKDEMPITGFGEYKTTFMPAFLDSKGNETNGNGTDLQEIIQTLEEHPVLTRFPELKERFWDMFVVDAWIGNNDRNNGNWGMIRSISGELRISPIFDNGAAFLPKTSDEKLARMLKDPNMLANAAYKGYSCIYELNGHRINPLNYISEMQNEDCNEAVQRMVPRMDLEKCRCLIDEIPEAYKGVTILSDVAKEAYKCILDERYEHVLLPTLENIRDRNIEFQEGEL